MDAEKITKLGTIFPDVSNERNIELWEKNSHKYSIDEFIQTFKTCNGLCDIISSDTDYVTQLFTNGFCYHFAYILKWMFPDGEIYLEFPRSHIIFRYKNKFYDIHGDCNAEKYICDDGERHLFNHELNVAIPLEYIPKHIVESFKHSMSSDYPVGITELIDMYVLHMIQIHGPRIDSIQNTIHRCREHQRLAKLMANYIRYRFSDEAISTAEMLIKTDLETRISKKFEDWSEINETFVKKRDNSFCGTTFNYDVAEIEQFL